MAYVLSFKALTWYKDSHSLFDYESNKISQFNLDIPLPEKHIGIFRKKNCTSINNVATSVSITNKPQTIDRQVYDLLSYMKIKQGSNVNSCRLEFSDSKQIKRKNKKTERQNTDESNSSTDFKEETYIVVSRLRDLQGVPTGCKLSKYFFIVDVGQIVKLGRVQYFVSQMSFNNKKQFAQSKNKLTIFNRNIIKFSPDFHRKEINSCKICLDQGQTKQNFLFNPCRCAGSCGTVHIQCLQHWIQVKVKKQTIGGTTHFNYQKFECEICKTQLPMIIDTTQTQIQLLPIEKPKGNYMILQAACQKTKSVMLIRNPGPEGIKLGRGHECQIRITDISVSRNHAKIKMNGQGFYIYDNKSKFGTLVRDQNIYDLEVGGLDRGIQMGRTFVQVQVKKKA